MEPEETAVKLRGQTTKEAISNLSIDKEMIKTSLLLIACGLMRVGEGIAFSILFSKLERKALAADALVVTLSNIFMQLSLAFLDPITIRSSEAFGAMRFEGAGQILRHGCGLAIFLSIPITLIQRYWGSILELFGQKPKMSIYIDDC